MNVLLKTTKTWNRKRFVNTDIGANLTQIQILHFIIDLMTMKELYRLHDRTFKVKAFVIYEVSWKVKYILGKLGMFPLFWYRKWWYVKNWVNFVICYGCNALWVNCRPEPNRYYVFHYPAFFYAATTVIHLPISNKNILSTKFLHIFNPVFFWRNF